MPVTDPIADMLTRIRNANQALHETVAMPASKLKEEIAKILAAEGFIGGYDVHADGIKRRLELKLKYGSDRARIIEGMRRLSKPGRRLYSSAADLPRTQGGLGVVIISTSQGLMPDREARRRRLGGEVLCEVW